MDTQPNLRGGAGRLWGGTRCGGEAKAGSLGGEGRARGGGAWAEKRLEIDAEA